MNIRNFTIINKKISKQRLLFMATTLNAVVRQKKFSSNASEKESDPVAFFDSIWNTSINSYINPSKVHLLNKFLKPKTGVKSSYNFVFDETVAKDIVKNIVSRVDCTKSLILEENPGLGLVTINLINSGATKIIVSDTSALQTLSLKQIVQKHSDKVKINKKTISSENLVPELFDKAQLQNGILVLIGINTNFSNIRYIVLAFLRQGFWRRPFEIYFIFNSYMWESLTNVNSVQFKFIYYCAFNILFITEKIASYPSSAFLPSIENSFGEYTLARITLNPNFLSHLEEEDLIYYIIFLNILSGKPKDFVIPTLEKWLPDCGPYLISKGLSMSNVVEDLTYQESVTLFNFIKKCEGYNDFKIFVTNAFENTIAE